MAKLRCKCLNICIHAQGSDLKELNGESFLNGNDKDDFFNGKIYEVQLALGGIRKEVDVLLKERKVEDWIVYKCIGCMSQTYALHSVKMEERVLVSPSLQMDENSYVNLTQSKSFSPAFKIILPAPIEEQDISVTGFSSETMTSAEIKVHDRLRRYLKAEEEAMLERIKKYSEEQKKLYSVVQLRALSDKRALLSVIKQAVESKVQECLSDAMTDLQLECDLPDERPGPDEDLADSKITPTQNLSTSWSTRLKETTTREHRDNALSNDIFDPMFQIDEDYAPFVESDEEESSDNSFTQTYIEWGKSSSKPKFSSSVPVNVPMMDRSGRGRTFDDDEKEDMPSPDKIAESIQALAQSHDSRYIFGELPRPRKNTLPINN